MIDQTCPDCENWFITDEYTDYTDCPVCNYRIEGDEYNGSNQISA